MTIVISYQECCSKCDDSKFTYIDHKFKQTIYKGVQYFGHKTKKVTIPLVTFIK